MDRWAGILKVPLHPGSSTFYRVATSLCLSSKGLAVPSANVIFFNGDRVEGTGDPVIEKLSDLQNISQVLLSKFGATVNTWVIEASIFNGAFAIYKDFIPNVNQSGEPVSYDATGFPASSSIILLLYNCFKESKSSVLRKQKEQYRQQAEVPTMHNPKTIILGFSKGGTVVNQLLTELGSLEIRQSGDETQQRKKGISVGRAIQEEDQFIPTSTEGFLNSITELHYVDVGLNSKGAYLTNKDLFECLPEYLKRRPSGIRILLHGTPRQWYDRWRIWIRKEKDEMVRLLKLAAQKNMGTLIIRERLYFPDKPPSLRMHFQIIENLDVS